MKKIWKENRVLFCLIIILIICFIAICSVVASYFVGTHKSIYGERLVDKIDFKKEDQNNYLDKVNEDKLIENVEIRKSIRTIYIDITFKSDATLVEAKSKAELSLEFIDEEILSYYDINFILTKEKTDKDSGFVIMGARNSNGNGVTWNNNNIIEEENTDKE